MLEPISHHEFKMVLCEYNVKYADLLVPFTNIEVKYEREYLYNIYVDGEWDSQEKTIKGVRCRVRQLYQRSREDLL